MAKFFVGQRVRKVYASTGRQPPISIPVGAEGVIVEIRHVAIGTPTANGPLDMACDCAVDFNGDTRLAAFWQIEPATDANDKLAWTDERCVWKPEHMREEA